jgi:hypothetical protein
VSAIAEGRKNMGRRRENDIMWILVPSLLKQWIEGQ